MVTRWTMHQLLLQSWDAVTPVQRGAPPCVVGRRCGVMHVFNNSPLAPCVLAHLPSRVNVYAYARWPVNRSPACCYCMPFPSGNQAAVWYPTPRLLTTPATFFFSASFCFHHLLPSSPFTPRLLSSHFLLALMGFFSPVTLLKFTISAVCSSVCLCRLNENPIIWVLFIYFVKFVFLNEKEETFW